MKLTDLLTPTPFYMMDFLSSFERSKRMSLIRGKDTALELKLRRALHSKGFRYRLYVPSLPGKPDIVLPKYRTIIFINGCFWHGHKRCRRKLPRTNSEFWNKKILSNRLRDARNIKLLRNLNWRVLIVWECSLKNQTVIPHTLDKIISSIKNHHN